MNEQSTHRPSEVLETLKRLGVRVAVTVPDSWLGEILVRIEREPEMSLIRATHEEEALAIACGARLGGLFVHPIDRKRSCEVRSLIYGMHDETHAPCGALSRSIE